MTCNWPNVRFPCFYTSFVLSFWTPDLGTQWESSGRYRTVTWSELQTSLSFHWISQQKLRCTMISVLGSKGFLPVREWEIQKSCCLWALEQLWGPLFITFCGICPPYQRHCLLSSMPLSLLPQRLADLTEGFLEASLTSLALLCTGFTSP